MNGVGMMNPIAIPGVLRLSRKGLGQVLLENADLDVMVEKRQLS